MRDVLPYTMNAPEFDPTKADADYSMIVKRGDKWHVQKRMDGVIYLSTQGFDTWVEAHKHA